MNRSLSIRSKKSESGVGEKTTPRHRFNISTLRGLQQPDLSKKLYKLIKSENHVISAYETAGRERAGVAEQLSSWGESTGDDAISDLSDKMGVLLAEIAEQEDIYAHHLEEYRSVLKNIRDCEAGVQPSRDSKAKIADEIAKLKYKEPTSTKIELLEQELVRAEAQSLVAEAQLTNVTRQKFRVAHDILLESTIERAEKQIILARHARRLLNFVDDTPIVPGDTHPPWESNPHAGAAREVINDAEEELRGWKSSEAELTPANEFAGTEAASTAPAASSADTTEVHQLHHPVQSVSEDRSGNGNMLATA